MSDTNVIELRLCKPHADRALLPVDYDHARLPITYNDAVRALRKCARIDECKDWADKAAALASYAAQSKDVTLEQFAARIKARATRRCGQLLMQIPYGNGANQNIEDGKGPNVLTRKDAATDAGLSERQRKTALRVANVPEEAFEQQVESDEPPTVFDLAEQGKAKRAVPVEEPRVVDLGDVAPADFARAMEAQDSLRRFAEYCATTSPESIAKACQPDEIQKLREYVRIVDRWLDVFAADVAGFERRCRGLRP